MHLELTINLDSEAFRTGDKQAACGHEAGRILARLGARLDEVELIYTGDQWRLVDINGETAGHAEVKQ